MAYKHLHYDRMTSKLFGKFKLDKKIKKKNAKIFCKYPKISKLKIKDHRIENISKPKEKIRKKNGCFCCRKRRIKCIGSKPVCDNCNKSSYQCIWPDGDESLSHNTNFQLVKIDMNSNKVEKKRTCQRDIHKPEDEITDIFSQGSQKLNLPGGFFEPEINSSTSLINNKHQISEIIEDALYRNYLVELNSSMLQKVTPTLSPLLSLFPDISSKEANLFDAFVNGFMIDVSPQLTHCNLQPTTAFIPSLINSSIAQKLFCATGAAFLYSHSKRDDMKALAEEAFVESATQLDNYISQNDISSNLNWILIYLLIAYLKMRFVYEGSAAETLSMISIVELMKLWVRNKAKNKGKNELPKSPEITTADEQILKPEIEITHYIPSKLSLLNEKKDLIGNSTALMYNKLVNSIKTTSKNIASGSLAGKNIPSILVDTTSVESEIFMVLTSEDKTNLITILPYERTIIESFVFNYSNLLFVCERSLVAQMTSPFIMFDLIRPYLQFPIYRCAVPWMNHPVVGAALPMFELQAKVCWLGLFYPLSATHRTMVNKIKGIANFYTRPILPLEVKAKEPENIQKKLLESCYAADFVSKAVFIYSMKLLNPDMDYTVDVIQNAVAQAYEDLVNISVQSQIHMILGFAFVVVGSVAIKEKHRSYLMWKLERLREVLHVATFETLMDMYRLAWAQPEKNYLGRGWDILIDPETIKKLVI